MEAVDYETPTKKTDNRKCVRCKIFIRKLNGPFRQFDEREDAMEFHNRYNFYVQSGDVICNKCRHQLSLLASKRNKIVKSKENASTSNYESQEIITLPLEEVIDDVVGSASQSKTEVSDSNETPTSQQSYPSSNINYFSDVTPTSSQTFTESPDSQESDDFSIYAATVQPTDEYVSISFPRVIVSHRLCFICKSTNEIQDVPFEARLQVFISRKIFIPHRNRCCKIHLINKRFYDDEVLRIETYSDECSIKFSELAKFMDALSDGAHLQLHDQIGSFTITEKRIKALTGYTWDNIIKLQNMMVSMRSSENRNIMQALVLFLFKMKSGNSNKCISAIFGLEEKQVAQSINSVLKCFENEILPKNFGIHAYSRELLLEQTTDIAKMLYNMDNKLALICDGTYLRHQKSSNNAYQRKSYSGQKKASLCKPFTICTTNGFIVDCAGPFTANCNDAKILENLLKSSDGFNKILEKHDIFILDRGFRDVIDYLNQREFTTLMPALKGKRSQLTTEESNASRRVTKLRWVVEAIHGIIGQKYKLLHHQLHNGLLTKAGLFCKIACFLQNLFGKRLNSDAGNLEKIISRINLTNNVENTLAIEVEEKNWNRKTVPFQHLSSNDLSDFPEMTLEDLKVFFTGSYQLSQSVSYLAEIIGDNGSLTLSYAKEQQNILRFEVQSRHINSKKYKCYIDYCSKTSGINGIKRYCCNCANGNRTVGCCSHVAAVIYYLSHARYLSRIIKPAAILTKLFDFEEVVPVIEEISDDED